MPEDYISPEMSEKIQQFCRNISETYNFDEDIQEELYGHIEDKMLGYLSGEEPLTEDDAFVLVREHFGDSAAVRELLNSVHRVKPEHVPVTRAILNTLYALAIGLFAAWFVSGYFMKLITQFAADSGLQLVYYALLESFTLRIYLTVIFGTVFTLPFGLYYFLSTVFFHTSHPGHRSIFLHSLISNALFSAGFLIMILIFVPNILGFLKHFIISDVHDMISMKDITLKMMFLSILLGLMFEVPVLLSYLTKNGLMNYRWLSKYHRHAIVAIFILSAFMTPPDPVSQILMALPLIVLFEISLRVVRYAGRKTLPKII
ncbi:MAG: twin-arginine translocase subunit TatC [Candidatus Latescibacteria bacterium]|nr:twin-arginine translocase subunit TatC [Candidatus Latescibacterota bacterium]